jgi:hypothetical protein
MEDQVKLQEKAINEIIERYGDTIDLKNAPYLIVEILQQFQDLLGGDIVAECLPPGGPPRRDDFVVLIDRVLREVSQLSVSVNELHRKFDELQK